MTLRFGTETGRFSGEFILRGEQVAEEPHS
jgi:hypothetical protein